MFATAADGHGARRIAHDAVATARPNILDRNGEILAIDVRTPSLFAEPQRIIDVDEASELLTAVMTDMSLAQLGGVHVGQHRGDQPRRPNGAEVAARRAAANPHH